MRFEWSRAKAENNLAKHAISFEEAATVFGDPLSLTVPDPDHSKAEDRFVTTRISARSVTLVVVHADRGDAVRIVGCRRATARERRAYEESI